MQAVVNIAADRRMTTTAEGVETAEQRQRLRALGCSEMQGYLFSAPKPAAEIRQLLRTHRQNPVASASGRARKRRPVGPHRLIEDNAQVRNRPLLRRRRVGIDGDAAQQVEGRVQRLVVLLGRRNVGLRAGLLGAFGRPDGRASTPRP